MSGRDTPKPKVLPSSIDTKGVGLGTRQVSLVVARDDAFDFIAFSLGVLMMIHVIATIELAAGRRDEFLAIFRNLMPKVHAEQGCLEYGPAVDTESGISVQQIKGGDVVTVIEKWESVASLRAHLEAPHMQEYREQVRSLVQHVTIHVLEPA